MTLKPIHYLRTFTPALLILLPGVAQAYIPPSLFIIKTMAKKHASVKGVRVRSTVTAMESEQPTSVHFKEVTVYDPATHVLYSRAFDDANHELYAVERKSHELRAVDHVLFDGNGERLAETLKKRGIPVLTEAELAKLPDEDRRWNAETESLSRLKNKVAWIIGTPIGTANAAPVGKKGETAEPTSQLWVEKDTFFPMRVLLLNESGEPIEDVRFENYHSYRDFPYPSLISALDPGAKTLFKAELNDILVTSEVNVAKGAGAHGFTDEGNAAPSAVKDLIKQYYERIR